MEPGDIETQVGGLFTPCGLPETVRTEFDEPELDCIELGGSESDCSDFECLEWNCSESVCTRFD